jgi:hypothetical protein
MGEISPVSNTYPDFVIEYKRGKIRKKFSVECKWRASISKTQNIPLFLPEQISRYQEYAREKKQNVVIVLGVGGEPSMPEDLYLIPVDSLQEVQSNPSLLKQYMREEVSKWFSLEEFCKSLKDV